MDRMENAIYKHNQRLKRYKKRIKQLQGQQLRPNGYPMANLIKPNNQ